MPRTKRENKNNCRLSVVVKKQLQKNHLDKSRAAKSMFLSSLPHKMSYASLIDALHKASQHTTNKTKVSLAPLAESQDHLAHAHSVFHDLITPPSDLTMCHPPSSPLSLLISLPRHLLDTVLSQRYILTEHNYTPLTSDLHRAPLPPSARQAHSLSACSSQRLSLLYMQLSIPSSVFPWQPVSNMLEKSNYTVVVTTVMCK